MGKKELFIKDEYGNQKQLELPNPIIEGLIKASMMKEALASSQIEGIGLNLTLEDLYLAELGYYKNEEAKSEIQNLRNR